MAKTDTISLPALPDGQVYKAILDKPFTTFCKYSGEVDKAYTLNLDPLSAESMWNLGSQAFTRIMGTVTVPQDRYPNGETRLHHCDSRYAAMQDNTYGYGSGGGGKSADLLTKFLREAVLGIVLANMTEYKGRKVDAIKDVAADHESMFFEVCKIRAKNVKDSGTAEEQFKKFWPVQVAAAESKVAEKRKSDAALANAFDLGDFAPAA